MNNQSILEYMQGGIGKVDVLFERDHIIVEDHLAFEFGIFKDITVDTGELLMKGYYNVTWIHENEGWKIKCHTWSIPIKD